MSRLPLKQALIEKGWASKDFEYLLHEDMPQQALEFVRTHTTMPTAPLNIYGEKTLEEVFTEERTKELSYSERVRISFFRCMHAKEQRVHQPINTISELAALSRRDILQRPRVGVRTLDYIEAVLGPLGIKIRTV